MGLHIIIIGNPVDGFSYFGPYKTRDDAINAADKMVTSDWWIAPLRSLESEVT